MNDGASETYSTNSHIKSKTKMLQFSLCDYSDAYILVKGTNTAVAYANANNESMKVIFKNCILFTYCISKIGKTQVRNANDIDVVMLMYHLVEVSKHYSKTLGGLWQYSKDKPGAADINGNIVQ